MTQPYINIPTAHKSRRITLSRTEFISSAFFTDNGAPFKFKGREYLEPIYNQKFRYLVILASRQAEKSSFIAKDMLADAILNKNDSLLYVTAQQRQSDEFVHRKINRQFELNSELALEYLGPSTIDNVRDKMFSNGTTLSFRAIGQNADSARGLPARKIFFDETQSILSDNIPIVSECAQSYPDDSAYVFSGTPLSTKNVLSQKYYETKQFEWIITCTHCSKANPSLGMEHIDPKKPYLFCLHCGKEMEARNGAWVAMNPDSKLAGYRISRLMTPACTWRTPANDGVLDKLDTYPEAAFCQEVLGLPFDSGNLPITEEEVFACCDERDFIDPFNPGQNLLIRPLFAVIDWAWNLKAGGRAFTIMAIGMLNNNRIEILYVKRFSGMMYHNPDTVLNEIADTCNRLKVQAIGTDFGVGHKENYRLVDLAQAKVFEMLYTGSPKVAFWDNQVKMYKIGRTASLDLVFNRLKKRLYSFPRQPQIAPYASDILNVYTEYDPNWKRIKYEHAGTGPDDFLHLLNYLGILVEKYVGGFVR
jgi:hypothetical protein